MCDLTPNPKPEVGLTKMYKKLSKTVRVVFFMIQKSISKSKDLQILMKRGKVLGESVNHLMIHTHTALSCRPHDVHLSFVSPSPRYYEFSCSDTPPPRLFHITRRKSHKRHGRVSVSPSPSTATSAGVENDGGGFQVDEAAEEFIQRFYMQLRLQKWMAGQSENNLACEKLLGVRCSY
ncbi:uncharacterized protein LOC110822102 [Carica papaya]|uniref:uncharacterized protein LOC110822102 n=1 Tax=Carica papaya TaxID=3649 RepID=UPI000B8CA948|nr:uncharacterized protein LOC110822102 [Carica papaya]